MKNSTITSKLMNSKLFTGVLPPIVAIFTAFFVSGLIILVFITTYSPTEANFQRLLERGVPAEILKKLEPMIGQDYTIKERFKHDLDKRIGKEDADRYFELFLEETFTRENPIKVYNEIFTAALKDRDAWGNVLYRATPLIFTGLAVALAFQCGLFNIGGEGQMVIGGFAMTWVGFSFTGLPSAIHIPMCVMAGIMAGAFWGGISGYLKAKRGVHEVVTTIMLNWIGVALIQYLTMAYKPEDTWIPHTFKIAESAQLSRLWVYLNPLGIEYSKSILLNTAIFFAIAVVIVVWFILNKTKIGYEIKAVGFNSTAAENAGINVGKNTILAMAMSGAIAGMAGINQVMGYKHRFRYGVFEYLGFDGIGVAFIGKNSPVGVVFAAILFGILDQGGLAIDVSTKVPREIVLVIKAAILIFVVLATEITKMMIKKYKIKEEARI